MNSSTEDKIFVILMSMLVLSVVVLVGIATYVAIDDANTPKPKSHCTCKVIE